MTILVADSTTRWLRSHRAGERSFQRALREFFQGQAQRVADALADFDEITPAVVPQVFQPEVEAERLQPLLNRHLRQLLALGASDELSIVEAVRTPDKSLGGNLLADLPDLVLARIRQALTELEGQDYWQAIQAETETRLAEIIRIGIDQEASNYQIGIRIRDANPKTVEVVILK